MAVILSNLNITNDKRRLCLIHPKTFGNLFCEGYIGSLGVTLVDTLDAGLAFVDGSLSITPSSGAITFTGSGTAGFSNAGSGTTASGRRMTIDLGAVTNSNDTTATTSETLTVTYQAVVLNSTNNHRNNQRNNNAVLNWSLGSENDSARI